MNSTRKIIPMNGGTQTFTPPAGGLSLEPKPAAPSWMQPARRGQ